MFIDLINFPAFQKMFSHHNTSSFLSIFLIRTWRNKSHFDKKKIYLHPFPTTFKTKKINKHTKNRNRNSKEQAYLSTNHSAPLKGPADQWEAFLPLTLVRDHADALITRPYLAGKKETVNIIFLQQVREKRERKKTNDYIDAESSYISRQTS